MANLQDYNEFNFDDWTKITKPDIFHFLERSIYPLEAKDKSEWARVSIEMNLDRLDYSRSRYTFLDVLAAFGGFMGIWRWIFSTYMAAWNTNALDNFLVSKLYRVEPQIEGSSRLERSKWPHLGSYLLSWVPAIFVCCKKS